METKLARISQLSSENAEEENLEKLERQLKQKAYKPKPARRVEIPKENGKTRPLSIVTRISWYRNRCADYRKRYLNHISMKR